MASALRAAAEATPTFVRQPMQLERDETYALNHLPQVLADCWESLMGRAPVRRMPTQAVDVYKRQAWKRWTRPPPRRRSRKRPRRLSC